MAGLKLYAFEGMVWLREQRWCGPAKHEAFKTEDQSLSQPDVMLPAPTVVELLCVHEGGSLVRCHLVDQINMWESELATRAQAEFRENLCEICSTKSH